MQKSSASAVAESSHCASSTTQSTVCSSAAVVSMDRVANATKNGSTAVTFLLTERDAQRPSLRCRKSVAQSHHWE